MLKSVTFKCMETFPAPLGRLCAIYTMHMCVRAVHPCTLCALCLPPLRSPLEAPGYLCLCLFPVTVAISLHLAQPFPFQFILTSPPVRDTGRPPLPRPLTVESALKMDGSVFAKHFEDLQHQI